MDVDRRMTFVVNEKNRRQTFTVDQPKTGKPKGIKELPKVPEPLIEEDGSEQGYFLRIILIEFFQKFQLKVIKKTLDIICILIMHQKVLNKTVIFTKDSQKKCFVNRRRFRSNSSNIN